MHQTLKRASWLAALAVGIFLSSSAQAQFVTVYSPPRVIYTAPAVSYYPPVTSYYPPVTSYYAPVTSYYAAPVTTYYTPTVSYYAPTTVYSAPAVVSPGYVTTTRSYYGLGIFRPFGYNTQTYITPATVVTPATSYYTPIIIR